nr:hypothetical protein [Lysinibacillus timonensis]
MNYNDLAKHFTETFTEFKPLLQQHLAYNGEVLNHVFFGECNEYFIDLISKEKDINKIKSLFEFFERMAIKGDNDVKELLSVTILARLGDSKKLLQIAYKYMGAETMKASDQVEKFWGRY